MIISVLYQRRLEQLQKNAVFAWSRHLWESRDFEKSEKTTGSDDTVTLPQKGLWQQLR
jgi:hypothetical protein